MEFQSRRCHSGTALNYGDLPGALGATESCIQGERAASSPGGALRFPK